MKKITWRWVGETTLYVGELYLRVFLAALLLVIFAVIGGFAIVGVSEVEVNDPNAFDEIGGFDTIHLIFDMFIPLMIIFPLWILVAFRERQIYNAVKGFIQDRQEKKPVPKSWYYLMILIIIIVAVKIVLMEIGWI